MTGKDLAKKIREVNSDVLVFGLTADTRIQETKECIQSGMNNVLYKPVKTVELNELINKYKA